jgi:hypothetical protein
MKKSLSSFFRFFALTSISLLPICGIGLGLNPSLAEANISLPQEQVVVKQKLIAELTVTPPRASNLSGVYQCNDGGTYYVRQTGNQLWWYGQSGDGVGWTNVFRGTIQGNEIGGNWADVPKGNNQGAGVMNLRRVNRNKFISTYQTGGFSGSEWTRK